MTVGPRSLRWRLAQPKPPSLSGKGNGEAERLDPLVFVPYIKGEEVPPREWIVPDWIPLGKPTLIQGDGGIGKSALMQQLQASCATALAWLGKPVKECVSIGVYTEDNDVDLKERQIPIDVCNDQDCRATGKMHMLPMLGRDPTLLSFDRNHSPVVTPFFRQLKEAALDLRVGLITLDVAADLFGGDEIKRREVRAFIRLLSGLGRDTSAAVVLTGHVSQAGLKSDGGHSASTDWSNGVRSRAYLGRPKGDENEDEPANTDERLLTRKKANYASIGDTIKLRWQNGILVPQDSMPSRFPRPVEDVFLALLDAHNGANRRPLSESNNATNYAPRVFSRLPDRERDGYRSGDFQHAMETLFKGRKIVSVTYGRPGDERRKIVRNVD